MNSQSQFKRHSVWLLVLFVWVLIFSAPTQQARGLGEIRNNGNAPIAGETLKTIIVNDYYPYTFVNEKGEPDGFSVDLIKAVAQTMGFNLEIKVDLWDNARHALENGAIDFLPMMAYSKERDKTFDFSPPHTIAYDAFFTREDGGTIKSIDDLRGKTILVMEGDQAHDYLLSIDFIQEDQFILVKSLPDGLRLLASGKGDAALMPKLVGLLLIKDLNLGNLEMSPVVIDEYNRPFSFAVREGNQELLERLTQGLDIIKSTGQYDEIYDKWFGVVESGELSAATFWKYLGIAVLIFSVVWIASLLWSLSLRRQVAARTEALEIEIREREKIEAALRESENSFRAVVQSASASIITIDANGAIVFWNHAASKLFGWSKDEILGQSLERIMPRRFYDAHQKGRLRVLTTGETNIIGQTIEMVGIRRDDREFPIEISLSQWKANDKDFFTAILRDISERKQHEDALAFLATCGQAPDDDFFHSLARYLAKTLDMDYVCIDRLEGDLLTARTVAVYFDGRFEDNTTYTLKDTPCGSVAGKSVCSYESGVRYMFPKDQILQEMAAESYSGVLLWGYTGKPIGLIAVIGRKPLANPKMAESLLKFVAVRAAGELERKQAEGELRQSEARLQAIHNAAGVAIVMMSTEGKWLECNRYWSELLGYPESESRRLSNRDITHPDDLEITFRNINSILEGRLDSCRFEKRCIKKDGGVAWMDLSITPIRDENGQIVALVAAGTDITERKNMEEERSRLLAELERKNKELESIIYIASHDLRSPVVNVHGFSEYLKKYANQILEKIDNAASLDELQQQARPILAEKIPDALKFIEAGARKMDSLINGLLRLSRLGRAEMQIQDVDMNLMLNEIMGAMAYQIEKGQARVKVNTPLDGCRADRNQINQAFSNLIDNAIKYRAPDRPLTITISSERDGTRVIYSVADTGTGIAQEHQAKIWEVFQRIGNDDTIQGEGLGLSLARRIVERHDGKIRVESELGIGSCFYIELPASDRQ